MIKVENVNDISREEVLDNVRNNAFEVLRGLIDPNEVAKGVQLLKEVFSVKNDHGSLDVSPEQILNNFQKWSVGSVSPKSDTDARLLRIFYNPLWCEDIYKLHGVFNKLVEIRNHLQGMPEDYGKKIEDNNLYSACRIQFYPKGGGFMQSHTDHIGEGNIDKTEVGKFIQILVVLSKKGKDFIRGGGFVVHNGKRIFVEDNCELGDVIIYDGLTIHGVEDVDPHLPLDTTTLEGRLVGFATLYKIWS
jgi:hypothetical protein